MPRKGQRLKTRKVAWPKPRLPKSERVDPLAHLPLAAYLTAHLEWMGVSGYSEDTIRARRIALKRFIAWCEERSLRDPKDITKPILERYQRHLFYYRKANGRPMTLGTQFGCLAPLKTFFKWLTKENHIFYNPASELALPKLPKHLPRVILSIQEIEAILREAEPTSPSGLRDRAMLETLYSTALRRMELPGLALYDVDLTRRLVMVREGKGKRDRVVPIGERAAAWVEKYLQEGRPQLLVGDTEGLFLTDYGEPASPEYVAERVRRYMHFAGIKKPGAAHLFRHACATHMLENGADTASSRRSWVMRTWARRKSTPASRSISCAKSTMPRIRRSSIERPPQPNRYLMNTTVERASEHNARILCAVRSRALCAVLAAA